MEFRIYNYDISYPYCKYYSNGRLKNVSSENLILYREERLQATQVRLADSLQNLRKDSIDDVRLNYQTKVNDLTIKALNDQATIAQNSLDQQALFNNLQREAESSNMTLDSIAITMYGWGYLISAITKNTGRGACSIEKAAFYIVNEKKNFLLGGPIYPDLKVYNNQTYIFDLSNELVPKDVLTDNSTLGLLYVKYYDYLLKKKKQVHLNVRFFSPPLDDRFTNYTVMPVATLESKKILSSSKNFILKKSKDPSVFD